MNKYPLISIIIATFNSERTLECALHSVTEQTFPKNQLEILIVDGGSNDRTLTIARDYKCRIIKNILTEPLSAKYLGFLNARGKYIIGLDHDEVFINKKSLEERLKIFNLDNRVKALHSSGYITPDYSSPINYYVNEFGDPFSFFIYRLTKDFRFFIQVLRKRYTIIYEDDNYFLIKTSISEGRAPLMEVLAAGGMVDRMNILKEFKNLTHNKELFLPHLHIHLLSLSPYIAVMKNDPLYHNSAEGLKNYLRKLEWRVRNNVYFHSSSGSAGFLKREQFEGKNFNIKKFFFIPYSLSVLFPLFDALWLSVTRHNIYYLIHLPLCLYTSFLVMYHYTRRTLGYRPTLTSYDGSSKILKQWR